MVKIIILLYLICGLVNLSAILAGLYVFLYPANKEKNEMISPSANKISGGDFFNCNSSAITEEQGNKNIIIINSKVDYNKLKELLNNVSENTDNAKEKECARQAVILCDEDKKTLKQYIIDNLITFTTGTFATASRLLEMIQTLIR